MALTAASNAFSKKKMPKTAGQKQPSKNSRPRTAPAGFGGKTVAALVGFATRLVQTPSEEIRVGKPARSCSTSVLASMRQDG